jgi:hypothetical protein
MHVKRLACLLLTTGFVCTVLATPARVITMGRTDAFFMDDISIFKNPANVNVYPNMLVGDLGSIERDTADSADDSDFRNLIPRRPFFGGVLSYSLNQSTDAGDQFPMLSIGAVFNRYDPMLDYVIPGSEKFESTFGHLKSPQLLDPVGKIDILVGYAMENGGMVGVGGYTAFQDSGNGAQTTKLFQGNLGVNWPISKTMDIEVSAGASSIAAKGTVAQDSSQISPIASDEKSYTFVGKEDGSNVSGDLSFRGDVRLFSALTTLNGDFVPQLSINAVNLQDGDISIVDVKGGIGINLNIDRGFFWTAVQGLYNEKNQGNDITQEIGGRIMFGIERNIIFDWLVWRLGGNKKVVYQLIDDSGKWIENAESNGGNDDMIGFGMGVNIENRFKVDAVMAEDLFYTWTNLFSGRAHHLFTRLSATYSF